MWTLHHHLLFVYVQDEIDDMLHNDEDLDAEDIGGGGAAARYRELELMRHGRREQTEEEMAKYLEEKYK